MNPFLGGAMVALLAGALLLRRSLQIVEEGTIVLVERFGKYQATLTPGINYMIPLVDRIECIQSVAEQIIEIDPRPCTTTDAVSVQVGGALYWKVTDVRQFHYAVLNAEALLRESLETQIQTQVGKLKLDAVLTSQQQVNNEVLQELQLVTQGWGVSLRRVELGDVAIPESLQQSMERQKAAEIESRATKLRSEGEQEAEINRARATARSRELVAEAEHQARMLELETTTVAIAKIAETIASHPHGREALQFILAQKYLETTGAIAQSANTKVLFIDPQVIPRDLRALMQLQEMGGMQPFGATGTLYPWMTLGTNLPVEGP
ncbi:MAG: SPFH/Band 7/PHB domain protein [Oscillatoriales cyanobacterium SM2_2_1]|nr:SPFH/Band 7/PHB domain protein [Oscillatoriales cyanobacterium SM2_2_1]